MKFLSVCSGIEAASVAWAPLGWSAVAFSEIEPFPCAMLAHHYPDTPNWGDMTKYKDWPDVSIDLLCGGTPCQSFSVAGLREGLADPRGNLMLTFGAIAAKYRPQWLVWENVPGVLSSNEGRDFASFLGLITGQEVQVPVGGWRNSGIVAGIPDAYGAAYRVLDAQYFGVAQRRRRVFVVGCLGDWRSAAAVLFERHSMQGHPAPSRQAGKGTTHSLAPSLTASGRGVERCGETRGQDPVVAVRSMHETGQGFWKEDAIAGTLRAEGENRPSRPSHVIATLCVATGQAGAEIGAEIGADMAPTLNCNHEAPYIAHSLRGEGFDAREDGTGLGTPLVPVTFNMHKSGNEHSSMGIASDRTDCLRAFEKSPFAVAYSTKLHNTASNQAGKVYVPAIAMQINACSLSNSVENKGFNKTEISHACTQETDTIALLRRVREAIGAQAFAQWGLGILDSLQSPEILRSALHGSELRPAPFSRRWVVCCALGSPFSRSSGSMHSMREAAGEGCSPQGWGFSEQQFDELGTYLSELSQPGAQAERLMHDLWQASEGSGLLRNALSTIQEARRPTGREGQPIRASAQGQRTASPEGLQGAGLHGQVPREGVLQQTCATGGKGNSGPASVNSERSGFGSMAVRRLVVEECEFLQGFPRSYTAVPHRGKPAADGPRYKSLGNSWAVPNVRWIGQRIEAVNAINALRKAP